MSVTDFGGTRRVQISDGALQVAIIEYGAIVQDMRLAGLDRALTLSLPTLDAYRRDMAHIGAIAGRVAGRIAGGAFTIDGVPYRTTLNEDGATLHGGTHGFGRSFWSLADHGADFAELTITQNDGEEGFPGRITATCRYTVADGALHITLRATTDHPTLCNLAQHSYFNLAGGGMIGEHRLQVTADRMTPLGPGLLPSGAIVPVSPALDFRAARPLADTVLDDHVILADAPRTVPMHAATLSVSDLSMDVATTEPGLVIYTADKLSTAPFAPRAGICLEPQLWPDAVNHPHFPATILRPGADYMQKTVLRFTRH